MRINDFTMDPGAALAMGVVVGLASTCVQSIGLTLQRKSHMLEDEKRDESDRRPPFKRRRWQIGMFLFLVANIIGSTIQIVALPLPLLSTLQASGLVFNSILASLLLQEPWTLRTAYGTVLVAAGAVLISFFSAMPEPSHSLQQLLVLLGKPSFLVWFILSLVFVAAVLVMTFCLRYLPGHRKESPRIALINGMAFGLVSGVLSAHALLLAKSAVELVVRSIAHKENQFKTFEPWLLLLAFLFLSLSQLYYLHLGLKLISTSVLYPFVFCIYNIVAILDGLIYFQQMDRLPPLSAGLIALGTVLLLAGVLALSWRLQDDEDGEEHHQPKAEIPQTLIAPGMGFVGDPDTESSDTASAHTDDELDSERETDEHTQLIRKTPKRSHTTTSRGLGQVAGRAHSHSHRRRHRASTLREVRAIWESLEDTEDQYGTFDRRPSSAKTAPGPGTLSNGKGGRRASAGKSLEPDLVADLDDDPPVLSRSSTAPVSRRPRRKSRSALFSDLLSGGWWHSRKKDDDDTRDPDHDRHNMDGTSER
ncbi:Putative magnesium transporter NIPA [Septoria linicola]|uniref:Magnesium transporter NIPA n=1 Tax=Septoria linicola TaxID=215465 RepID=A0A9Q9EDX4_9PEZI|nr:putative magnesium transporter NIPA [Septoria linicola]USW47265.1 Putative magnesium transporter NIPA [Septoria linicola]